MSKKKFRLSITWSPFYASLAVISALGLFIGVFWTVNEYHAYVESIENIKNNYHHQYEYRLVEEVNSAEKYIKFRLEQDGVRAEKVIRDRVQTAYTVASHIYRSYKAEKSHEEMREIVSEILRPIRWGDGHGYYFVGRLNDGIMDLFADEPLLEGKNAQEVENLVGYDVVGKIKSLVDEKGAGVLRYQLAKPLHPGEVFSKIAFVKYFKPFDWFIGAGFYEDDLSMITQQDILSQLQNMDFGEGGEIFAFDFDGTIICSSRGHYLGRSIRSMRDSNDKAYGIELLKAGRDGKREGFVTHQESVKSSGKIQQKLSYVRAYPELNWIIGASIYMDSMEQAIYDETKTYQRISFRNVAMFIILFILSVSLLLFSTYIYSLKIKKGVKFFTDFFRNASDTNEKVKKEQLDFVEFIELAELANKMIDERALYELLLHRDELRLDTLLSLGMMDKYTLQDKYNFILERILQITGSKEGYVALINGNQSHLTLCSCAVVNDYAGVDWDITQQSTTIDDGGLAGRAVHKKNAIICNEEKVKGKNAYPYTELPKRHLDVPIYNNGKVVLVAGVCNSEANYGNSDIRQMTMLLEGMWLHVIKKCAEEENLRLERQILTVSEEERSAIGRDLHDDLCSHLSGVELLSKVLHQKLENEAPAQAGQLGTIRDLIRDAIDKTRRLSHGLYPVHIFEYGLEAAIEELVVEVKNMFNVTCLLDYKKETEIVDTELMVHLYYIVREAVFNGARHGKPEQIEINVILADDFLLEVIDDGVGFDEEDNRKGLGFYTMEYRARMLGAYMSVSSMPDQGTRVAISGMVN
ncbi:MAG: cache domain-containing protein [Desulfotalea sp.]